MIDDEIEQALARWAQRQLDATPDTALPDLSSAPRRRPGRLMTAAAAAVIVIAVAIGASLLSSRDSGSPAPPAGTSTPAPPVDTSAPVAAGDLVVHDGDTVTGQGVVLALPGRPVRFCAPGVSAGVGGHDSRFDYCQLGVTITGVDLNQLTDRATRGDGAVYGRARLTGTYRRETLSVVSQSAAAPEQSHSSADAVPCSTPTGGWPDGTKNGGLSIQAAVRYQQAHPGVIVQLADLHPSAHQVLVYALTSGDPAPVEAALRPHYGKQLCVQRSRWTSTQLAHATRTVNAAFTNSPSRGLDAPTSGSTDGLGPDAQIQMTLEVPILGQALADKLGTSPLGLIHVDVWLTPRR